mgnify:CR=1 FL=1
MSNKLIKTLELKGNVTLVGGAGFSKKLLSRSLALTDDIVAADGGANFLPACSVPKYILGDLDSIVSPEKWIEKGSKLIKMSDQDSTDFDKCISVIKSKKIIALGFMDQRLDHFLAVCSSLVKNRRLIFVVGKRDVMFHLPNDLSVKLPINSRVSLFPLNEIKTVEAVGLKYPVENLKFSPMGKIGTSNVSTRENIRISYDGSGMLGIFSSRHLDILYNSM